MSSLRNSGLYGTTLEILGSGFRTKVLGGVGNNVAKHPTDNQSIH